MMRRNGVFAFALALALALVLLIAPAVSTGAGGDTLVPAAKSLDVAPGYTADSATVQSAIGGLAACSDCGNDLPEAYNRAFYEAGRLDWAPNTPRFIVVLGDSYGHDPNQGVDFGPSAPPPNCSPTAQADPGPDGIPGNADDLGTLGPLTTLKNTSTNVSFVTYNPGAGPADNVTCQAAMARFTGGNEVV